MEITTQDIRKIFDLLIDHIDDQHGRSIVLNADYYWHIPEEERTNIYVTPSSMDIGQLTEDWERLNDILLTRQEPIGYAFIWLSEILRSIGEQHVH